jgi:predicted nuclease with TOPRIM domain
MDPDVDIYKRQMQEEVKEKYQLYKRIDELVQELELLKEKIKKLEEKSK